MESFTPASRRQCQASAWSLEVTGIPTSASIAATRSARRRLVHETNTASSRVLRASAAMASAIESTEIRAASLSSRLSNVANAATSAPCAFR